jgi:hypothetical protein
MNSKIDKIKKEVESLRNIQRYCTERTESILSELEKISPANPPRKRKNTSDELRDYYKRYFANK